MLSRKSQGFSLIELLIVLTIVAILASIAIPNYRQHIVRARRDDAKAALVDLATRLEQFYVSHHSYAKATIGSGTDTDVLANFFSPEHFYQLKIIKQTETRFIIEASPIKNQAKADTQCASFRLNELGEQSVTGASDSKACWN